MKIIEIAALTNGAHRNQTYHGILPEGWAIIPNEIEIPKTFPFVNIETDETGQIVIGMTEGIVPNTIPTIKANKEQEISSACNQAIVAGMDVETSKGLEHFSLQETDQINLTTATNAVQQGLTEYPYHADGQLCRMFTAKEILSIADAATKHKLYHTTLCNHLLTWIRRAETKEELDSIIYSEEVLPEDLKANMAYILALSPL